MKFNLHKFLKYALITVAVLGITGGSFNGTVNAKHRSYYVHKVRKHHRYRVGKIHRNHHHKRHIKRVHGLSKYIYYVRNKKEFKDARDNMDGDNSMSMRKFMHKYVRHGVMKAYDTAGYFQPVSVFRRFAKEEHTPLARMLYMSDANYGPIKSYYLQGSTDYLSKNGLTRLAHLDGLTASQYLKKYLNTDIAGNPINSDTNKEPKLSTSELQQQMKDSTINDINNDRQANGLDSYNTNDEYLNNFAQQRAEQLPSDFSHDGAPDDDGENIAYVTLGDTSISGDPNSYDNHNGHDMAHEVEDSFMNYDNNQDNVHRDNILGDYNNVGVGTYSPDGNTFYVAEDFN